MNRFFSSVLTISAFGFLTTLPQAVTAGDTGFAHVKVSDTDCLKCPKRSRIHSPYRQCEDSRRYNAAPCTPPRYTSAKVYHRPVIIETVMISKATEPRSFLDSKGNRHTSHATVITYKDLYSNGDCRTRTKTIAGSYEY